MNILSMECSSPQNSIALFKHAELVSEGRWEAGRKTGMILFEELERILSEARVKASELNEIIVGKGPGNFSGMRIAMSAAQGLALPGNIPLTAVSSGEALAFKNRTAFKNALVLGDARRDHCWLATFSSEPRFEQTLEWTLCDFEETSRKILAADKVYSSESSRLAACLGLESAAFIPAFPRAEDLLLLQEYRNERNSAPEVFEPLYMHPAVS